MLSSTVSRNKPKAPQGLSLLRVARGEPPDTGWRGELTGDKGRPGGRQHGPREGRAVVNLRARQQSAQGPEGPQATCTCSTFYSHCWPHTPTLAPKEAFCPGREGRDRRTAGGSKAWGQQALTRGGGGTVAGRANSHTPGEWSPTGSSFYRHGAGGRDPAPRAPQLLPSSAHRLPACLRPVFSHGSLGVVPSQGPEHNWHTLGSPELLGSPLHHSMSLVPGPGACRKPGVLTTLPQARQRPSSRPPCLLQRR